MDEPDWRPALAVTLRLTSVANLVEGSKRDLGLTGRTQAASTSTLFHDLVRSNHHY
jgi:hypothetical protein